MSSLWVCLHVKICVKCIFIKCERGNSKPYIHTLKHTHTHTTICTDWLASGAHTHTHTYGERERDLGVICIGRLGGICSFGSDNGN